MAATSRDLALERLRAVVERARSFSGWSFPDIDARPLDAPPPWDYEALVREHAAASRSTLDLGTGGGELVARVRGAFPGRLVATEEWAVNAPVARDRLRPLGAHVVRCRSLDLPFASEAFDLVIDRHEELDPAEVARVLRPGGRVLTQQVGRDNWRELRAFIPRMTDFGDIFGLYATGFEEAGLRLTEATTHSYHVAYRSLDDFVYMLAVTPWTVPGFDIERDLDALLALEGGHSSAEGLVLTWSRFLIMAGKHA